MRIAIVDDLMDDREKLCADICRWAKENQVVMVPPPAQFASGEALLAGMNDSTYDVIFLDIYMHGINGMDTARQIRKLDADCRIIFTTQSPEYAVESYDVESSYYLLKPYSYEKLTQAMKRCGIRRIEQEQSITIPGKSGGEKLYLHDIVYTEYMNRRVVVHKKDGSSCTIPIRQSDFADTLLEYPFFCDCMKGVLVNFEAVEQLEKDRFLLKDGKYIPISRLKYQNVREAYLKYSYAKMRED